MTEQQIAQGLEGRFYKLIYRSHGPEVIDANCEHGVDDGSELPEGDIADQRLLALRSMCAAAFNIRPEEMRAGNRATEALQAKCIFAKVAREKTTATLVDLALALGTSESKTANSVLRYWFLHRAALEGKTQEVRKAFDAQCPPEQEAEPEFDKDSRRLPKVAEIAGIVSSVTGVSLNDIICRRRSADIVRARYIFFYLADACTRMSLLEIGRRFQRDHSTVHHGIKCVQTDRDYYEPHLSLALAEIAKRYPERESA